MSSQRGGGDLSSQDGPDPKRHDAIWYRRAALRELFEGSGILLARDTASGAMLHVSDAKRGEGRRAIHAQKTTFAQWLKKQDSAAEPDTENLIPFTRWVNPIGVPYRYTTQMYLYFLPMDNHDLKRDILNMPREIHELTHDGGIEITDARFLESSEWLRKAVKKEVKLLPPQYFLVDLMAQFLDTYTPKPSIRLSTQATAEKTGYIRALWIATLDADVYFAYNLEDSTRWAVVGGIGYPWP
ncbi:hypothetical protein MW887_007799 [Aspergillus wentii]|nr:hypothetical protein MW887_007799 [Aspergillus wentii]